MSAAVMKNRRNHTARQAATAELDYLLLLLGFALLGFGFLMVTSASLHLGDKFGVPFYYSWKHLFSILMGLAGGLVVMQIPSNLWQKYSVHLFVFGLVLLVLVLIPGIGRSAGGATRWIPLGIFNLQSSEFMKLFVILYMAGYLVRRHVEVRHSLKGFMYPMVLLGLASALIVSEPDMGTTIVILVTALGMLFLGGAQLLQFIVIIGGIGGVLATLILTSDYRMARFTGYLDPWADVNGSGYQLAQALIAFGRGEWTGVGYGNGIQKQFYLPEAHNDFLMAVIGEEFGLFGTVVVVLVLALFVWRAFVIGTEALMKSRRFAAYVAYGIAVWMGFQAFVNIGVNVGLLPTKGITLPFMSFGGNSIIVACLSLAMLLRIDYENRQLKQTSKRKKTWRVA
ncbi:MAG: putative lipid II flippase FtsW [Gammaproteobacteria bacterium]|nr:putative lipid II flippase FtsW [Gammaproteobacteria bacterium]